MKLLILTLIALVTITAKADPKKNPELHFDNWSAIATEKTDKYEYKIFERYVKVKKEKAFSIANISYFKVPKNNQKLNMEESLTNFTQALNLKKITRRKLGEAHVIEGDWLAGHRHFRLYVKPEADHYVYSVAAYRMVYSKTAGIESEILQRYLTGTEKEESQLVSGVQTAETLKHFAWIKLFINEALAQTTPKVPSVTIPKTPTTTTPTTSGSGTSITGLIEKQASGTGTAITINPTGVKELTDAVNGANQTGKQLSGSIDNAATAGKQMAGVVDKAADAINNAADSGKQIAGSVDKAADAINNGVNAGKEIAGKGIDAANNIGNGLHDTANSIDGINSTIKQKLELKNLALTTAVTAGTATLTVAAVNLVLSGVTKSVSWLYDVVTHAKDKKFVMDKYQEARDNYAAAQNSVMQLEQALDLTTAVQELLEKNNWNREQMMVELHKQLNEFKKGTEAGTCTTCARGAENTQNIINFINGNQSVFQTREAYCAHIRTMIGAVWRGESTLQQYRLAILSNRQEIMNELEVQIQDTNKLAEHARDTDVERKMNESSERTRRTFENGQQKERKQVVENYRNSCKDNMKKSLPRSKKDRAEFYRQLCAYAATNVEDEMKNAPSNDAVTKWQESCIATLLSQKDQNRDKTIDLYCEDSARQYEATQESISSQGLTKRSSDDWSQSNPQLIQANDQILFEQMRAETAYLRELEKEQICLSGRMQTNGVKCDNKARQIPILKEKMDNIEKACPM